MTPINENKICANSYILLSRYYVCLEDAQIAAQLPAFIEDYNLGDHVEVDMGPFGAGPGGFNNFLNMIGAAIGVPPPPGVGGHGHGAAGGGGGDNGSQAGGANGALGGGPNAGMNGGLNGPAGGFATATANGIVLGMGPLPPFPGGPGGSGGWNPGGPPATGTMPATHPPQPNPQGGYAGATPGPNSINFADLATGGESYGWEDDDVSLFDA